jgi:nucleotide-binding universal stress UspA family protein
MSWPLEPLRRIVSAVDGSETSLRAAEAAIALAARSDAELVFVHVLDDELLRDLAAVTNDNGGDARLRLQHNADQILGDLAERAASQGVSCKGRMESGDPPRVIDELARELGADVILVGKVGRRGVRRWLVGSVTRRLIESTHIPVLVLSATNELPERHDR